MACNTRSIEVEQVTLGKRYDLAGGEALWHAGR